MTTTACTTTSPERSELEEVRPGLWSCPRHEDAFFRQGGDCPACEADALAIELAAGGPET